MPSAGSTVPITSTAGTWTTKMSRPVRVSTLTRMLNPSPKNAFVSPRVHHGIFSDPSVDPEDLKPVRFMGVFSPCDEGRRRGAAGVERLGFSYRRRTGRPGAVQDGCHPGAGVVQASAGCVIAANRALESATQPKMPPCAETISSPTRWNSGKYDPTQSDSTRQSY